MSLDGVDVDRPEAIPPLEPFVYLASPYTLYPGGLDAAFHAAAREAARLIDAGHRVYCPIAHCHPISLYTADDATDGNFWLERQWPFAVAAAGLVIAKLDGWESSRGVREEWRWFLAAGKPVYRLTPL